MSKKKPTNPKTMGLLFLMLISAVALFASVAVVMVNPEVSFAMNALIYRTHLCSGNHYERRNPTEEEYGVREYWICCHCHQMYFDENDLPENSRWDDCGVSALYDLYEGDPRYIPVLNPDAKKIKTYITNAINDGDIDVVNEKIYSIGVKDGDLIVTSMGYEETTPTLVVSTLEAPEGFTLTNETIELALEHMVNYEYQYDAHPFSVSSQTTYRNRNYLIEEFTSFPEFEELHDEVYKGMGYNVSLTSSASEYNVVDHYSGIGFKDNSYISITEMSYDTDIMLDTSLSSTLTTNDEESLLYKFLDRIYNEAYDNYSTFTKPLEWGAEIRNTASLATAISEGGYHKLGADVTITSDITFNKNTIIDLNGHTIYNNKGRDQSVFVNFSANAIIFDNVGSYSGGIHSINTALKTSGNKLVINGGHYVSEAQESGSVIMGTVSTANILINDCLIEAGRFGLYSYGNFVFNNGTITSYGNTSTLNTSAAVILANKNGEGVINGGTFTHESRFAWVRTGQLTINEANVNCGHNVTENYCIYVGNTYDNTSSADTALVINSGTYNYTSNGDYPLIYYCLDEFTSYKDATFTSRSGIYVKGGTFRTTLTSDSLAPENTFDIQETYKSAYQDMVHFTGGNFNTPVYQEYIDAGYACTPEDDHYIITNSSGLVSKATAAIEYLKEVILTGDSLAFDSYNIDKLLSVNTRNNKLVVTALVTNDNDEMSYVITEIEPGEDYRLDSEANINLALTHIGETTYNDDTDKWTVSSQTIYKYRGHIIDEFTLLPEFKEARTGNYKGVSSNVSIISTTDDYQMTDSYSGISFANNTYTSITDIRYNTDTLLSTPYAEGSSSDITKIYFHILNLLYSDEIPDLTNFSYREAKGCDIYNNSTLDTAISQGGYHKLTASFTLDHQVQFDNNTLIDFNGYTITNNKGAANNVRFTFEGNVILLDTAGGYRGGLTSSDIGLRLRGHKAVINGGKYVSTSTSNGYSMFNYTNTYLIVNNARVESSMIGLYCYNDALINYIEVANRSNATNFHGIYVGGGTVTINDGLIDTNRVGIQIISGKCIVNDITINNSSFGAAENRTILVIYNYNDGTPSTLDSGITINGGHFNQYTNGSHALLTLSAWNGYSDSTELTNPVEINGGSFRVTKTSGSLGFTDFINIEQDYAYSLFDNIHVKGGDYNSQIDDQFIDPGYYCVKESDNLYLVTDEAPILDEADNVIDYIKDSIKDGDLLSGENYTVNDILAINRENKDLIVAALVTDSSGNQHVVTSRIDTPASLEATIEASIFEIVNLLKDKDYSTDTLKWHAVDQEIYDNLGLLEVTDMYEFTSAYGTDGHGLTINKEYVSTTNNLHVVDTYYGITRNGDYYYSVYGATYDTDVGYDAGTYNSNRNSQYLYFQILSKLYKNGLSDVTMTPIVTRGCDIYSLATLKDAAAEGGYHKVTGNFTLTEIVRPETNMIIDWNGYVMTVNSNSYFLSNKANMVVYDSKNNTGGVVAAGYSLINFGNKMVINNGKYRQTSNSGGIGINNRENGTMIINGGYFYSDTSNVTNRGHLTVNGGYFSHDSQSSQLQQSYSFFTLEGATTIFNGGEIHAQRGGIVVRHGTVIINYVEAYMENIGECTDPDGGYDLLIVEFLYAGGVAPDSVMIINDGYFSNMDYGCNIIFGASNTDSYTGKFARLENSYVQINGGTFVGNASGAYNIVGETDFYKTLNEEILTVRGGTFQGAMPDKYIAKGYYCAQSGSTYPVLPIQEVRNETTSIYNYIKDVIENETSYTVNRLYSVSYDENYIYVTALVEDNDALKLLTVSLESPSSYSYSGDVEAALANISLRTYSNDEDPWTIHDQTLYEYRGVIKDNYNDLAEIHREYGHKINVIAGNVSVTNTSSEFVIVDSISGIAQNSKTLTSFTNLIYNTESALDSTGAIICSTATIGTYYYDLLHYIFDIEEVDLTNFASRVTWNTISNASQLATAATAGGFYRLSSDITFTSSLIFNNNTYIDFNDYTLFNNKGSTNGVTFDNNAIMILHDNYHNIGGIKSYRVAIRNYNTIYINGGTYNSTTTEGGTTIISSQTGTKVVINYANIYYSVYGLTIGGEFTFNNGVFACNSGNNTGGHPIEVYYRYGSSTNLDSVKVTINNGSFTANSSNGLIETILDGTYDSSKEITGFINIKGGTFISKYSSTTAASFIKDTTGKANIADTIHVTGGKFNGQINNDFIDSGYTQVKSGSYYIVQIVA